MLGKHSKTPCPSSVISYRASYSKPADRFGQANYSEIRKIVDNAQMIRYPGMLLSSQAWGHWMGPLDEITRQCFVPMEELT